MDEMISKTLYQWSQVAIMVSLQLGTAYSSGLSKYLAGNNFNNGLSVKNYTIVTVTTTAHLILLHMRQLDIHFFVTNLRTPPHVLWLVMHGKQPVIFQFCKRWSCKTILKCVLNHSWSKKLSNSLLFPDPKNRFSRGVKNIWEKLD